MRKILLTLLLAGCDNVRLGQASGDATLDAGQTPTADLSTAAQTESLPPPFTFLTGPSYSERMVGVPGAVIDDYLYVVGAGDSYDQVLVAKANADGSLSSWGKAKSLPAPLDETLASIAATSFNHRLYIFDTVGAGGDEQVVTYFATPNSTGTFFEWTNTTAPQDKASALFETFAWNGYLYAAYYDGTILRATVLPDGNLSAWSPAGTLPHPGLDCTIVLNRNFVYAMGVNPMDTAGADPTGTMSDVFVAALDDTGLIGSFHATTSMPGSREGMGAIAFNDTLYAFGGVPFGEQFVTLSSNAPWSVIQAGKLNADGTVDHWSDAAQMPVDPTSGSQSRLNFLTLSNNGFVYLIGGWWPTSSPDAEILSTTLYAPLPKTTIQ